MDLTCEHCKNTFSSVRNLIKHQSTAQYCKKIRENEESDLNDDNIESLNLKLKSKDIKIKELSDQIKKFKKDIKILNNNIINLNDNNNILKNNVNILTNEIKDLKEEFNEKTVNYEKQISHDKGRILELSKNKPNITNNTNNYIQNIHPKLAKLSIKNIPALTNEYVRENIPKFTFDLYTKGVLGASNFIIKIAALKDKEGIITERNFACTDKSRDTFFRLANINNEELDNKSIIDIDNIIDDGNYTKDKKWEADGKARFINNILDELIPTVKEHQKALNNKAFNSEDDNNKEFYLDLSLKLSPIYNGFIGKDTTVRMTLVNDIRSCIKGSLAI